MGALLGKSVRVCMRVCVHVSVCLRVLRFGKNSPFPSMTQPPTATF